MTFSRTSVSISLSAALLLASPLLASPAFSQAKPQAATAAPAPDRGAAYYHFGMARMYEEQATSTGRQDLATQAIEQYKLALNADPDSRLLQDGLSNLYFKLGRIREAVTAAQDQVNKHPDDVDAHILLGRVYLRSLGDGQTPQSGTMLVAAIKEYETIARLKPDDLETHLLLGQLYGLNHQSDKAEEQFKAAQKIDGTSEEVVISIARLYSEQGNLQKAAQVLSDVPVDDRTGRMDFALAVIYDQLKQPKQAAEAYQAALNEDPDNMDAKRGLANALINSGQNEAASKLYSQLVGADPNDAESLIREAGLQRQHGDYEKSLSTLKKAEALAPDSLELKYNEALAYDSLGRYPEAVKELQDMLAATAQPSGKYAEQEAGNRALVLERLGIVEREAGHTAEAVAAYQQMLPLGGDLQVRGYGGIVQAYRDAHDFPGALKAAAEAAKALPANHGVQLNYADQLADAGKLDQALTLANAQLNGTPDDREVFFTIADINSRNKRYADADAALMKVEALSTKNDDKVFLYMYRGQLADKRKMFDEAETQYRKGLALDPNNADIENDYGYMLADRGVKLDESLSLLKKAVASDPQNYAFLDSLAWAYFRQGQTALAEEYSRKAVSRLQSDPTLHDHLGEIYEKNGKLALAIVEWQRALREYQTSLAPDADPAEVAKVQHKLEGARVRQAHLNGAPAK